eukprot:TRINITY_DN1547_c0_g1_i1.p1 TRINITY_DN1547_c0_g1~~TRINITY_DN1547_c0_g1_i1.p1  ORF type:complete len:304 (-),score=50.83 TRINITY_DN1547_c0_g1_i1:68-979(-)
MSYPGNNNNQYGRPPQYPPQQQYLPPQNPQYGGGPQRPPSSPYQQPSPYAQPQQQYAPYQQYPPPSQQYPQPPGPQYAPPQQYPPPASNYAQYPPNPYATPTYGAPPPPPYTVKPTQPQHGMSWYSQFYNQNTPQQITDLQAWFNSVDRDRSGTISAQELAGQPFAGQALGIINAAKLIKVFDKDFSGQLDFYEYASLHQFLNKMQQAFYQADADRSGYVDEREIHAAVQGAGFQLTFPTLKEICGRFDYVPNMGLSIQSFLQVCIHLARLRSIFEWNDIQKRGTVTLNFDQLSHIATHLLDK